MKTVYITESMAKLLKESVLANALPSDVRAGISQTPYGSAPLFMGDSLMCNKSD
jgi:hypothetical protein